MKRLTMISMAALMLLAVSCKKDKQKEIENAGSGFRATTENHAGDSKTHLDGTAVNWNSGDAIMVTNGANVPKPFTTTSTEGTATFTAAENLPINFYQGSYTAYYPADAFSGSTLNLGGTQNAVFDGQQAYVPTFGNGANPMMASSSTTDLAFKNICGLLQLQLWSPAACTVESITITTGSDNLCGSGTVAWNSGQPTLNITTGNKSVIFDCGTGVLLSTTSDSPTLFNIVLPAGTLNGGFTVEVTNSNNEKWTKQAPAGNEIQRSKVRQMPAIKVECKPNIPEGALSGVFTIDAEGRQVRFSKGNLQYIGSAATPYWKFADNQWDVLTTNASSAQNVDRDMFGWGTSGWDNGNSYYYPYNTENPNTTADGYGYGPYVSNSDISYNLTGQFANADWGIYNAIKCGNSETTGWRTPSNEEYNYLIARGNGSLCGCGQVKNRYGLILLPDSWDWEKVSLITFNPESWKSGYSGVNVFNDNDWTNMENAGAVFFPAANYRTGTTLYTTEPRCYYWSSSYNTQSSHNAVVLAVYARLWGAKNDRLQTSAQKRSLGCPVRLVKDVPNGFNGGNANDFGSDTW